MAPLLDKMSIRLRGVFGWSCLLAIAIMMCTATSARALELTTPHSDYLERAELGVVVGSADVTGTAVVSVDGVVIDTRPVLPGDAYTLKSIDLITGFHKAQVVLRSRDGVSASNVVSFSVWVRPGAATLVSPQTYAARLSQTAVRVGHSTTMLYMYVNDVLVNARAVAPNTLASMGEIELGPGVNKVTLVAKNPVSSTQSSFNVTRVDYPWPTCIIIDKSDFRLYWIRDGVLVKTYPVAIGKPGTPTPVATWRIDAKYITDPAGVYGPRKMRLFRQTSSGFVYTAYGIHGTNEPWVIGTMASHGCIRMYNSDVLELWPQVPLGTMVQTRQ